MASRICRERLYRICASTDANYVAPAAFGLARVRSGRKDVAGAVQALDLVPSTSRNYPESQRQKAELLYAAADGLPMLAQAMDSIARVRMDPVEKAELSAKIMERALATVQAKGPNRRLTIGGIPATIPTCGTVWRRPTGPWRRAPTTIRNAMPWWTRPTRSAAGP